MNKIYIKPEVEMIDLSIEDIMMNEEDDGFVDPNPSFGLGEETLPW